MKRFKGIEMKQAEESFTKIPNIILDDISLNVYEFRIMSHIARQTIGYGKKSDGISLSQFRSATGISVSKINETIKALKEKKYIKVSRQTAKHGGKSFNRYALTLIRHTDNHIRHTDNPYTPHGQPLIRHTAIQKKIEQKKIDKRRETETFSDDNIFFWLSDHEQRREAGLYAEELSQEARSPEAYKIKIRKQINKRHPETMEQFQSWYLEKVCRKLGDQFRGQRVGDYEIKSVYPFTDTEGYDQISHYESDHWIYAQGEDAKGGIRVWGADGLEEMREILGGTIGDIIHL